MGLVLLGLGLEMARFFVRALVANVNVCAERWVTFLTLAIYTIEVIDAIYNPFLLFFEGEETIIFFQGGDFRGKDLLLIFLVVRGFLLGNKEDLLIFGRGLIFGCCAFCKGEIFSLLAMRCQRNSFP